MEPVLNELIQVAAVACGAVEDAYFGKTFHDRWSPEDDNTQGGLITSLVVGERRSQDAKWGSQHHALVEWLMILLEEVGEAAELIGKERPKDLPAIDQAICAGKSARGWLESHEWPERQQRVYDEERNRTSVDTGPGGGGSPSPEKGCADY